jgi:iron-sulfur cluster assembly protein
MTMTATLRPRPKVMTLTDAAAERIRVLAARSARLGGALRIGIKKGGCAGMEYTVDWVDEPGRFDEVVEDKGARVVIDAKAVMFLLGTEMDYQVEKLKSGFTFTNPNQTSACGCGESVELKAVDAGAVNA